MVMKTQWENLDMVPETKEVSVFWNTVRTKSSFSNTESDKKSRGDHLRESPKTASIMSSYQNAEKIAR